MQRLHQRVARNASRQYGRLGIGLRNIVLHKVARTLRRTPSPTLVASDFNDGSWSKNTQ